MLGFIILLCIFNQIAIVGIHLVLEEGHLGGSVVGHLPLAQGMIPGCWIEPHIGLLVGSMLLHLPVFLPLSLCVSHE